MVGRFRRRAAEGRRGVREILLTSPSGPPRRETVSRLYIRIPTWPNSSTAAVAVPSMFLRHACRARAPVQGVRKVVLSSLERDKRTDEHADLFTLSTLAEFY